MDANAVTLSRLAFWSRNLVALRNDKMDWPGFSYDDPEWARMRVLAASVSAATSSRFILVNTLVFLVLAAAGMFGVFLPVATLLFPVPAETSALKFSLLLAICCLLILSLGLQVSMRLAADWSADETMRTTLSPEAGDEALWRKVTWQINRMTLVMCGLLVPGILIFITYDLEAGPIITALKWAAFGLLLGTGAVGALARRRRSG